MHELPPIRSWLYAPGNNARLLDRVFQAGADAVILDLEDAVPAGEKARARALVAEVVRGRANVPGPAVFVRINHPDAGLVEAELRALVGSGLHGLRVPKVEDAATVARVAAELGACEEAAGLAPGSVSLVCNVETARGVRRAEEIAAESTRVLGLAFGAADFARDIGAAVGPEGVETLYARSALVLASRVAGVRPPVDSVYTQLQDDVGFERSTRQGRALGFFGRSAIHPRQLPIIHAVYSPTAEELAWAREVVTAASAAEGRGSGAFRLASGEFVDVALVRRARDLLELSARLGAPA